MLFQLLGNLIKLCIEFWHSGLQIANGLGKANTRYHIFTLSVKKEVTFEFYLAGGSIT